MNKAFIRSIEAVLAIILFFSFYSMRIQPQESASTFIQDTEIKSVIESLQKIKALNNYADSYDLQGLSSILSKHFPPLTGFKIELNYLETITAKNNNSQATQANMSFLKFFPLNANLKSASMLDNEGNIIQLSMISNYYQTDLSIPVNDELINAAILLENISLIVEESKAVNFSSIHLFINNEPAIISIESTSYNSEPYDANASINALIPYAAQGSIIKATVFYSSNSTGFIQEYADLPAATATEYYSSSPIESKASEIIFSDTLEPYEEKNYALYYEINTQTENPSHELTANYSNIEVLPENNKYFQTDEASSSFEADASRTIKSLLILDNKYCAMNLKVWTYE